ncbi:MAG TPA: hypothetical protein DEF39_00420 [Hungateiclostridium thermocellum]|uniref:Uncharacterized protein n=2 Tax=Acetivibrio thermocellus TaxID=1515 RepID=A3DIE3_ACET2|nr:hypothetical protein [Acetivibrio thermocellus]CDG36995.1 hypothetical protein CTHBC1_2403 [Acetivibrio thermocellus BC1]ABN53722.1 hypothetical protein Cthe_2520 [Acetivibrio thermocellus ATCC 27405]ADU73200.1 hypothetical protein Clo1313_0103 [Acetivibrio thermocellus DSM 1313]ALX07115.1 hypothetical protein AD2_00104 [Acetivibrio thermocellus AD2]ANV74851.1 hypothetical protein LQRI_0103 [Acetivibrio thermocellus DSM 2360]
MILVGRLIKGTHAIKESVFNKEAEDTDFRDLLEEGLISLCRELDIPVPLWLNKNTSEFARYRKTFFDRDQFIEDVKFDRFELRME